MLIACSQTFAIVGWAVGDREAIPSRGRNKICREFHWGVLTLTRALRSCTVGAEHLRDCIRCGPSLQHLCLVSCTVPGEAFQLMPSLLAFRSMSLASGENFWSAPALTAEQLHCVGQLTNLQDLSLTSNAASHTSRSQYATLPAYSGVLVHLMIAVNLASSSLGHGAYTQ